MIHIRTDNQPLNSKRTFACGIGPELPEGDQYYFESERLASRADCPICNPGFIPWEQMGTPISQLSGRPGHPGYAEFCRITRSWGYD